MRKHLYRQYLRVGFLHFVTCEGGRAQLTFKPHSITMPKQIPHYIIVLLINHPKVKLSISFSPKAKKVHNLDWGEFKAVEEAEALTHFRPDYREKFGFLSEADFFIHLLSVLYLCSSIGLWVMMYVKRAHKECSEC